MDIECPNCHMLHWLAERDRNSSMANPTFNHCCRCGVVILPSAQDPPAELHSLLTSTTDCDAVKFRENIRHYNSALAFTSTCYQADTRLRDNMGFALFQIQRELYHLQGLLENQSGQSPVFA
jgi:hypothetical protein